MHPKYLDLEDYLLDFADFLQESDGIRLSFLMSVDLDISKICRTVRNLDAYLSNRIDEPWQSIILLHIAVLMEKNYITKAEIQNQLVQKVHLILSTQSKWFLPIVITVNRDLMILSAIADGLQRAAAETRNTLESAARTMNKAFSICATDRYTDMTESKKWGVYAIINMLFKTYFKVFHFLM
jgi:hypothetical protein